MIISQVRKRYKNFKFSWKFTTKVVCFLVFIFFVSYATNQFQSANYFPIKEVKIAGVHHLDRDEVQQILRPLVNKGFFVVNVDLIKERLMQLPWIAEASIRRVWPNHIFIQVVEKNTLARWNDSALLSTTGELFTPPKNSYPSDLPKFIGPEGMQIQMLNYFDIISSLLAPLNFKIARFEMTPARSWNISFTNGMKLNVGYKDILTRIGHFVKVYPKIVGDRAAEVDYIDMRYSNGIAVRWKT